MLSHLSNIRRKPRVTRHNPSLVVTHNEVLCIYMYIILEKSNLILGYLTVISLMCHYFFLFQRVYNGLLKSLIHKKIRIHGDYNINVIK